MAEWKRQLGLLTFNSSLFALNCVLLRTRGPRKVVGMGVPGNRVPHSISGHIYKEESQQCVQLREQATRLACLRTSGINTRSTITRRTSLAPALSIILPGVQNHWDDSVLSQAIPRCLRTRLIGDKQDGCSCGVPEANNELLQPILKSRNQKAFKLPDIMKFTAFFLESSF